MKKPLRVRELYCPSHFGNTYEVAGPNEMRSLLAEAKFWGYNRFSDWFDTIDLYDLYHKKHQLYNMPEAVWDQKFRNFKEASNLGYDLGLIITPNHVFSDQVTLENEATKEGTHIFGQLLCPSKKNSVEIILENYRNLFSDFAKRDLNLSAIASCPYDYGGCACEDCQPWIVSFGRLTVQIIQLAREFFPEVQAELIGWWWSDQEHQLFTDWAEENAPGIFTAIDHHILYGETSFAKRVVPKGCAERAFLNIGYGEKKGIDLYGHFGPTIAPKRQEKTIDFLFEQEADGFLAYSEGACDEINKAIAAGLASAQFDNANEVLEAYAQRHLGGDTKGWREWLYQIGDITSLDTSVSRSSFDRLASSSRQSWRLQALEEKLKMCEANAAVQSHTSWTQPRIAAAENFWTAKENLWRDIWKMGLGRHSIHLHYEGYSPSWNDEYRQLSNKNVSTQSQALPSEA
jgi:hypothetical protein